MAYEDPTVYAKYLKNKITSGCADCSDCNDCGDGGCDDKCSCCPAGLVAVYNADGVHSGCLTPSDSEEYNAAKPCASGFVKLYKNSPTPQFLGCVSQDEFATLYAALNPS